MEKAGKKTSPFLAVTLKNSAVLALIEKSHFVDLPTRTKTCKKRYLLSSFEMNRILCYLEAGVFSLPLYFFFLYQWIACAFDGNYELEMCSGTYNRLNAA